DVAADHPASAEPRRHEREHTGTAAHVDHGVVRADLERFGDRLARVGRREHARIHTELEWTRDSGPSDLADGFAHLLQGYNSRGTTVAPSPGTTSPRSTASASPSSRSASALVETPLLPSS